MATKSIEERATLDADKYVGKNGNFGVWQSHRLAYIRVATEQDAISRKEERERCISIAQNALCCRCIGKNKVDKCTIREGCTKRGQLWYIRQAMEEGCNL